jgi:hypothetical protein
MSRILIFSPYANRQHLTAYEGTIAKACQVRGATVEYLLCDGLLPECDNHWDSFPYEVPIPRPLHLCQKCQGQAKDKLSEFDLPFRWLGEFVDEAEREYAFNWAQSLSISEIVNASFMEYPVGIWVRSSVVSYFRKYPPDIKDWRVANVYRGFIYSAAIVVVGLRNYLNTYSVDAALLFNGRQSITRVAFEIFQQFGIRELTHEFPFYQSGHILVKPNARCWTIEPFTDYWQMWRNVPLSRSSLDKALRWIRNRRYGKGLSWYAFNEPSTHFVSVRKQLNLNSNKRLFALFTSSTDEITGDPELQGPYELQSEWVQDVVNWVQNRSDIELAIRVHPHLAGKTGLGRANDEFNFYEKMRAALPSNIRIIMPNDSLSSYALMYEADVCLSFGSSVGIEMAMMSKPVVLGARAIYENASYVLNVRSKAALPEMLEKSLQLQSAREIQREAFRLAYYYVFMFEMPFPLVSMVGVMDVKLNYTSFKALAPGQDDSLDFICDYLINGYALFNPPTDLELTRSTVDEDAFLGELEQIYEPIRDLDYERWLRRAYRLNLVGRSIQNIFQKLPFGTGIGLNKIGKAIYLALFRRTGG